MNTILISVLIVSIVGLIAGLGLAIASIVMAVPIDEKAAAVEEVLPGANCGACGFSGCAGYAKALSEGKTTETNRCAPGGSDVAKQIAELMGLAAGTVAPMTAVVHCQGTCNDTDTKMDYVGVRSCKMASQLFGGPGECNWGCIGYGDCVEACPYDAISICDGVARVNPLECRACKKCISTCPKGLISLMPITEQKAAVFCHSKDKGAIARKACSNACIGCMKCVKSCEFGAVTVQNFLATIDIDKCTACGKCAEACPQGCIIIPDFTAAVK